MLYQGGKTLELVDPSLSRCNRDEAAMCIQLGLLCCQQSVADRPDMNSVHLMLSSDSFTLAKPGKPGIQGRTGRWTTTASTSALTNSAAATTNASSTNTGATRVSGGNSLIEEYSRNSMSVSSIEEEISPNLHGRRQCGALSHFQGSYIFVSVIEQHKLGYSLHS
ncbi:hypothetical protein OIU84_001817 [Salix udensis]|uniref:Uncharacterized protein n=1 Tax=Salix udensis TaxID=889485 RepID=A0AAD6K9W2_9ROSI|nr:hypothetical protein OIU84_001817 [Salix udensis]